MANYVQFPGSNSTGQGYNHYGSVSRASTGNAYQPPTGGQPGYVNAQGQQPASPQPGSQAIMPFRMSDGTQQYLPVVARYTQDGQLQWVPIPGPGGASPNSDEPGMNQGNMIPQSQAAGGYTLQSEMYRQAAEQDPSNAKHYRKKEKEALKAEKQYAKKAREWDRDRLAREEAEAKQRVSDQARIDAERERVRRMQDPYGRDRRMSNSGAPQGILNNTNPVAEVDRRFNSLSVGGYQSASVGGRARRVSMSESSENPYQRSRRPSVSGIDQMSEYGMRARKPSGGFVPAPTTPGSGVGAFYPDRERAIPGSRARESRDFETNSGKSPAYTLSGGLPPNSYVASDGSGRVMGPGGGQMVLSSQSYAAQQAAFQNPAYGFDPRQSAPPSFYREAPRHLVGQRFEPFSILWDLNEIRKFSPPLPALLVPFDVTHDDWNRCVQDLATAWSGNLPYEIYSSRKRHPRHPIGATPASASQALIRPSSAVEKTIDVWNASFFLGRRLEMILFRGLERRSGMTAGRRSERLKAAVFPQPYRNAVQQRALRRRSTRDESEDDDYDSDSSFTSSSTSASSSSESNSDSENDSSEDDHDHGYVNPQSRERRGVGSHHIPQTPYPIKSRRNSLSVQSTNANDSGEMWVVKSREATKMIKARQKVERKRRKLERRKRRREMRGEPLYSVWMMCSR